MRRNTLNDWAAVLSHYRRAERLSWWRWARSAVAAESHAHFALDDLVPCLESLLSAARGEGLSFFRHGRVRLGEVRVALRPPAARPPPDRLSGGDRAPGAFHAASAEAGVTVSAAGATVPTDVQAVR